MNEEDQFWRTTMRPLAERIGEAPDDEAAERRLLAACRRQRTSRRLWRGAAWASVAGVAAAGLLIVFLAPARQRAAPTHAKAFAPRAPAAAATLAKPLPPHARRGPARRASVKQNAETTFYTLAGPEANEPVVRGQVVRVVMPGAALAQAGVPVSPERLFENVQADVLFGEDGSARAARIVPQSAAVGDATAAIRALKVSSQ